MYGKSLKELLSCRIHRTVFSERTIADSFNKPNLAGDCAVERGW